MDDTAGGGAAIPGFGGFPGRTAIGGIPRSAIPGLAASFMGGGSGGGAGGTGAGGGGDVDADHHQRPHDPRAVQSGGGDTILGFGGNSLRPAPPMMKQLRVEDAVFPSQWRPGVGMKLPGQTRVSPEEYKEFLALGHGDIFDIELDWVVEPPWRYPGIDPGDFFNYGMNDNTWKNYQDRVKRFRIEYTMHNQIQTMDQSQSQSQQQNQQNMHQNMQQQQRPGSGMDMQFGGGGWMGGGEDGGGGGGDKALQSTMMEERDEHYASFVTAERPQVRVLKFDVYILFYFIRY